MNNQNVLVLSITPYDFKDQSSNRQVTGLTVWLVPLNSTDEYTNGIKPVKYSLLAEKEELFSSVSLPAIAEMEFEFDFSRSRVNPSYFSNFRELKLGELIE